MLMGKWLKVALDYIPQWLEFQCEHEQPDCVVAVAHKVILLVEPMHLPFNPLTLVDITHDKGVKVSATHLDMGNGGLDRKLSSVGSSGGQAARSPDADGSV